MTTHRGIAKISFTGSTGIGKRVLSAAASTVKYVTMELGGKSPLIVFPDADLDSAVSGTMLANFYTQGEICTNGTRVFVHKDILEPFTEKLVDRTKKLKIGDPLDPSIEVGAMIHGEHLDGVLSYIESAKKEGARCRLGGNRFVPDDPQFANGAFCEPTIFDECTDDMKFVKEEIFGPVAAVLSFEDESEVISRANDSEYGLAGGIFTNDLTRAHRMAAALQCGIIWINNYNLAPLEMPFGGFKQSGVGRECGKAAIEHYTQSKSVYVEMGKVDCPYK